MPKVETGSFYGRLVTNGPLRKSLLDIASYRYHPDKEGPLTRRDRKWVAIALAATTTFGFVATKLIMGGTP